MDEWARGKTPEEVLQVTRTLMQSVARPFQPAQPAPVPQAQTHIDPEGYVTGAQAAEIQRNALAQFTSSNDEAINLGSSGNLRIVQQQYAQDFARYGPEIVTEINNLPRKLWSVDNLEKIVKYVKVGHLDEIAAERAQQLVNQMEPSMRSIGGAGTVSAPVDDNSFTAQWAKIPPEWRLRADAQGITETVVREFVAGNEGMTVQDFFKNFGSTAIGEGATR